MVDWLPDWRNGDEYPDPETTSLQEWAWEFLRRNMEFREGYDEIIKELEGVGYFEAFQPRPSITTLADIDPERDRLLGDLVSRGWYVCRQFNARFNISWSSDVAANPARSFRQGGIVFVPMVGPVFYDYFYPYDALQGSDPPYGTMQYFGVGINDASDAELVRYHLNKEACVHDRSKKISVLTNTKSLMVEINLEGSIPEQLKAVNQVASLYKKQLSKWNVLKNSEMETGQYQNYLRILDAIENGVEKSEIISVLFPHTSNKYPEYKANNIMIDLLRRAKEIRDRDYKKIIQASVI